MINACALKLLLGFNRDHLKGPLAVTGWGSGSTWNGSFWSDDAIDRVVNMWFLPLENKSSFPIDAARKPYYCGSKNSHISGPSYHDDPAWPCPGALCPCICRQPPESISPRQQGDALIANRKCDSKSNC